MKKGREGLKLEGVLAAVVTPNRVGTLEPDFTGLLELLDFVAAGGVNSICLMGSTGEFVNYSNPDRQRALYLAAKRSRVPLVVGVGHTTLRGSIELAEDAIGGGASGLLLMPPYFFPYQQGEVEAYCLAFAKEVGDALPILLYSIPQFTSPLEIDTAKRLLDTGRFAGIKDSSGNWEYFAQLLAFREQRAFALFAGNDRIALKALEAGADGVLSGCASAIPEVLVRLYKTAKAGDTVGAAKAQATLDEFIARIDSFPVPVGIKQALVLRGQKGGELACPLAPETTAKLAEYSTWFQGWITGALTS